MDFQLIVVSLVVVFMILALYREWFKPVIVFLISITIFVVSGILKAPEALGGFANEQIAVIFLLLIFSGMIRKTGLLDSALASVLNPKLSHRSFTARMSLMIGSLSGFLNNTPLVAIMLPNVYDWAKRKGISPSKVLLPLSYAAIVGGMLTLIGSSTNLVVNGLAVESSLQPLAFFEFFKIGVVVFVIMCIYLTISAPFLPDRKGVLSDFEEHPREFLVKTSLPPNSTYANRSVDEAGLRNLRGLFLVEINRNNKSITPVAPNEIISDGDELVFAGDTSTISDLLKDQKNMKLVDADLNVHDHDAMVETVITTNSSLIERTVKQNNFRNAFDASILAINRDGERITGRIGDIQLKAGDMLLLVAGKGFFDKVQNDKDLLVISKQEDLNPIDPKKSWALVLGFILSVVAAAMGFIKLFVALLLLICLVIILRVIRLQDFKKFMDFELIAILALAIGVGKGIYESGAANVFAQTVLSVVEPLNSGLAVLFALYIIANVLTMFVTNAASAAITFPVAIACYTFLDAPSVAPFLLVVALASSADFITPFGYQTNLMVFGPGGYKFSDYLRFGIIPAIITMLVVVLSINHYYTV